MPIYDIRKILTFRQQAFDKLLLNAKLVPTFSELQFYQYLSDVKEEIVAQEFPNREAKLLHFYKVGKFLNFLYDVSYDTAELTHLCEFIRRGNYCKVVVA